MITNFEEFLNELLKDNKFLQGDEFVYHFTSWEGLLKILETDTLKAFKGMDTDSSKVDLKYNNIPFISLTRKSELKFKYIKITLNKKKLQNNYKLIPYVWFDLEEAEERIYSDVKNIKRYITEVSYHKPSEWGFRPFDNYTFKSFIEKVESLLGDIPLKVFK